MSEVLTNAKVAQRQCASGTIISLRLSLFEDLIAELEAALHKIDVLSQEHPAHKLRPVRERAEERRDG